MDKKRRQWEQKVAEIHNSILTRLKMDEGFDIFQYKSLYFRIFREAYEDGFCVPLSYNLIFKENQVWTEWIHPEAKVSKVSGTSIWHYALEQGWCHSKMRGDEQRYKHIQTVMTWWDEWTYAWHNLCDKYHRYGYKTRRYRTIHKDM